jgi:hypothetical protein
MLPNNIMNKILIIAIFVSISCKQHDTKEKSTADFATAASNAAREDSLLIHAKEVTVWINNSFNSTSNKEFILEDFSQNDSLLTEKFTADSSFVKNYRSILRWSPDSAFILDIGSYGSVLVKDANGDYNVEAGEPDTEVALIDLSKKERKRLLMAGPSSNITDGKWVNNNVLLVTGTFNKTGNGDRDTLVWLINVKENVFSLYNIKSK